MSIYGVIGANGAGKTYYVETLAQNPKTALGKTIEDATFFGATPPEFFRITKTGWTELNLEQAEALLDFDAQVPLKKLSLGQKQTVLNAATLASGKEALLLDEPFNGLDAEHRENLREHLIIAAESADVVVTSQHSQDLAGLVDTLIVFHAGKPHGPFDIEDLRLTHPVLRGLEENVKKVTGEAPTLKRKTLGERSEVVLANGLSPSELSYAHALGVEVSYLDLATLIDLASASDYVDRRS